ncbi:MAG TPA: histidinol-phosphate transaminase [Caldilineaceae bacterium]|nr:histidinol-phosphate transaminase [Caldilineaceae bacterium]
MADQMEPHGTLDYAEIAALGLHPDELVVFSSNVNPYGPPPAVVKGVVEALTPAIVARYPDRLSGALRARLAAHHGVPAEAILVGNGTADILWLIGLCYARGRRVALLTPTFSEYEHVARLMDAQVIRVCHPGWTTAPDGSYHPGETTVQDTGRALAAARPDLVFVCNPNNPTGHWLTLDEMEMLAAAAPEALWVVDEAYVEFMAQPKSSVAWIQQGRWRGRWLVLRSMTKDFALGGLRLGYVVGEPALIASLQAAQPPWNVNAVAQLAGILCMDQMAWRDETLARLRADRDVFCQELRAAGFAPLPTTVNYFLTPVSAPTALRRALLARRLVVRDATSFGLTGYIRLATQRPEHNRLLVQALKEVAPSLRTADSRPSAANSRRAG